MYGLERSNDQAYNRDIVMHGAWYVSEDFMNSINRKTGEKYGRMGLSWGCPAVSLAIAERTIPYLKNGSLILHYHPSMNGSAVKPRISAPAPAPSPAPEEPKVQQPQEPANSEFDGASPEYLSGL